MPMIEYNDTISLMAAMEREVGKRTATAVEFGRQLQEIQAALGHQPTDLEVPE